MRETLRSKNFLVPPRFIHIVWIIPVMNTCCCIQGVTQIRIDRVCHVCQDKRAHEQIRQSRERQSVKGEWRMKKEVNGIFPGAPTPDLVITNQICFWCQSQKLLSQTCFFRCLCKCRWRKSDHPLSGHSHNCRTRTTCLGIFLLIENLLSCGKGQNAYVKINERSCTSEHWRRWESHFWGDQEQDGRTRRG